MACQDSFPDTQLNTQLDTQLDTHFPDALESTAQALPVGCLDKAFGGAPRKSNINSSRIVRKSGDGGS